MSYNVVQLNCPGCAAAVDISMEKCEYCGSKLVFSEFNDVYSMPLTDANKYLSSYTGALAHSASNPLLNSSAGMCYLKLKIYDKAVCAFENAIEQNFNNSEAYFYAAVALLNGKKAFLSPREIIDKAETYIKAAIAIEPRGLYYYFLAYIKYDYYERKFLNTKPDFKECLSMSSEKNTTEFDKKMLFDILGVSKPSGF